MAAENSENVEKRGKMPGEMFFIFSQAFLI